MTDADLETLAAEPLDDRDAVLLGRVAALHAATDPVPAGLVERISFGITLDALHAEIAELQRTDDLVGLRGDETTSAARTVTFTSDSLTTMITITDETSETARIDGWVAPGAGAVVELRTTDGTQRTTADADGRFAFPAVPRGLAQFRVQGSGGGPTVVTPSLEI